MHDLKLTSYSSHFALLFEVCSLLVEFWVQNLYVGLLFCGKLGDIFHLCPEEKVFLYNTMYTIHAKSHTFYISPNLIVITLRLAIVGGKQ